MFHLDFNVERLEFIFLSLCRPSSQNEPWNVWWTIWPVHTHIFVFVCVSIRTSRPESSLRDLANTKQTLPWLRVLLVSLRPRTTPLIYSPTRPRMAGSPPPFAPSPWVECAEQNFIMKTQSHSVPVHSHTFCVLLKDTERSILDSLGVVFFFRPKRILQRIRQL